jgi:hypothetical protein
VCCPTMSSNRMQRVCVCVCMCMCVCLRVNMSIIKSVCCVYVSESVCSLSVNNFSMH